MTARNGFAAEEPVTYTGFGRLLHALVIPVPVDAVVVTEVEVVAEVLDEELLVPPPVPAGRPGRIAPGASFVTRVASNGTQSAVVQALRNCSRVIGVPQKQPFWPLAQPVPVEEPVWVV